MTGAYGRRPAGPHDAILPVVLPDGCTGIATSDPHLAAVLRASGADHAAGEADVALAVAALPTADAAHRVALLGPTAEPGEGARWRDGIARARSWAATTATAAGVLRSVRGAGGHQVVRWDVEHRLEVAGATVGEPRLAERVPRRAAVVVRDRPGPWSSLFRAALDAAGVRAARVLAKEGLLVAIGPDAVVRVTLRAGADRLDAERRVIAEVAALLPGTLAALLPGPRGQGRVGVVAWAAQRRLEGREPSAPLAAPVRRTCIDVLTTLHSRTGPPLVGKDLAALAARAAGQLAAGGADDAARAVEGVARDVGGVLADVPTVWGHGDLWHGNLLVEGDRLTGIVDWDGGGPDRLPLEDLVQLLAADVGPRGALGYGRALVDGVLPWARAGGDGDARRLLEAAGAPPSADLLRALVAGAWLRRTAAQLERYGDRSARARWIDVNVRDVAGALRS